MQGAKRRGNPFPHTIKTAAQPGGGFFSLSQIVQRVHKRAIEHDAEVAVVAGGKAGGTHAGDLLAGVHVAAAAHRQGAVVAVIRLDSAAAGPFLPDLFAYFRFTWKL